MDDALKGLVSSVDIAMEESKKSCKSWGTTAKETSFKDEFNLESGIFVPTNQETNEEARIRFVEIHFLFFIF